MYFAFAAALACFAVWVYRRRRARGSMVPTKACWLLVGSGSSWTMRSVKRDGFMLVDGDVSYPISDCQLADFDSRLGLVYVFAASSVMLVDWEQFNRLKKTAITGAMLKPQSDIGSMLNTVGAILVIAAAAYTFQAMGGINSTLVQQQAQINKVLEIVNSPMVTEPKK